MGTEDEPRIQPGSGSRDESDVFVCAPDGRDARKKTRDVQAATEQARAVTLCVFGWHNVEPGPLAWAFPSLRAALDAVRTMRNAAEWCIVSGDHPSVDEARASGAVLIEQTG